jgi:hypothetical protein
VAKLLALASIAAFALALSGCGETVLDATKTEEQLESSLEKSLPEALAGPQGQALAKQIGVTGTTAVESVECPTDVEVEKGAEFTCDVTFANGAEAVETLRMVNEDADLNALGLSAPPEE